MENIIIINKNSEEIKYKQEIVKKWININYPDKIVYLESEYNKNLKLELIICIGGDGTLLYANKLLCQNKNIPIYLIGSGSLEFIPNNKFTNFELGLKQLFLNKYSNMKIPKIDINLNDFEAINECSIHRSNSSKILTLKIYVNNFLITEFRADGLIISTPIGSTAYNLSAGGALISPNNSVFIITPICPFTLSFRPLIISDDSIITIYIVKSDSEVQISGDGNYIKSLNNNDSIIIKKSTNKINMLFEDKVNINNWYLNLTKKLNWG